MVAKSVADCPDEHERLLVRRHKLVEEARIASPVLRMLVGKSPREAGSVVFYGARRDIVHASAAAWVADTTCGSGASVAVPGAAHLRARNGPGAMEVDLDGASSADARAFFEWVLRIVQSRHVMMGKHVIVVHAAERGERAWLARISASRNAVLVASTTKPDCSAIRSLVDVLRVRVACGDAMFVPASAVTILDDILARRDIASIRAGVHRMRVHGFTLDEIGRFASTRLPCQSVKASHSGGVCDMYAVLAQLAHASGGSAVDERAIEVMVAEMLATRIKEEDCIRG